MKILSMSCDEDGTMYRTVLIEPRDLDLISEIARHMPDGHRSSKRLDKRIRAANRLLRKLGAPR